MTDREVFHGGTFPFPFEGGRFPRSLGAVVAATVVRGEAPPLQVVHFPDGDWGVTDGVTDPNAEGALTLTHMWHVLEGDPSLHELASLPRGYQADRDGPGRPWTITPFEYGD